MINLTLIIQQVKMCIIEIVFVLVLVVSKESIAASVIENSFNHRELWQQFEPLIDENPIVRSKLGKFPS